jgi:hypothetical protein
MPYGKIMKYILKIQNILKNVSSITTNASNWLYFTLFYRFIIVAMIYNANNSGCNKTWVL